MQCLSSQKLTHGIIPRTMGLVPDLLHCHVTILHIRSLMPTGSFEMIFIWAGLLPRSFCGIRKVYHRYHFKCIGMLTLIVLYLPLQRSSFGCRAMQSGANNVSYNLQKHEGMQRNLQETCRLAPRLLDRDRNSRVFAHGFASPSYIHFPPRDCADASKAPRLYLDSHL